MAGETSSNPKPKPKIESIPAISVKLTPNAQKREEKESGLLAAAIERALSSAITIDRITVQPLVTSRKPETVKKLVQRARELDPEYQAPDFNAWYRVTFKPAEVEKADTTFNPKKPEHVDELVKRLHHLEEIESASALRANPPPVVDDDALSSHQRYFNAAPVGLDIRYAWGFPGGDGAGVGFVDMEQGWDFNHQDLVDAHIPLISGLNSNYFYHGTSVLGIVRMVDNVIGGIGAASMSAARAIGQIRNDGVNNIYDAIIDALTSMQFGDVLLLEAQETDPAGGPSYWPVEIRDDAYDAIRLATALGIIVVEPAGNGDNDLDPYTNLAGLQIFNRSSTTSFRDSGAIMVGSCSAPASTYQPHQRKMGGAGNASNYGSRIDVYAWGENVFSTTTDSAGTDNIHYTEFFGGTSGASAIISGACVVLQGVAMARATAPTPSFRFSPLDMRRILQINGTPSVNPTVDKISVMPDLRAIIDGQFLNIAPDLYIRDYVGDNGDPTSGILSQSPDIIVRQSPVANPQTSFGPGSGTENNALLSQDVLGGGMDQYLYVRVLNRGGSTSNNSTATVYWSPPSTLVTPNLWHPIASTTIPTVPTHNVLAVSDTIVWPGATIPQPGHYCFVALVGDALDPAPSLADVKFKTFDNYIRFISNNNNVAWRNFDVIPAPPGPEGKGFHSFRFLIPGAFDKARVFTIETLGSLPKDSTVELHMPIVLAKQLKIRLQEGQKEKDWAVLKLPPLSRYRIGQGEIERGLEAQCEIRIKVPADTYKKPGVYEFGVRQLYSDKEVGRLTWRFGQVAKVKEC